MQSNELRIGNLVYKSLKSGNGRKVENRIGCQDIVRIEENIGSFNYEPIPITEEWLLKFRFIYNGWNYDFERYVFHAQGKNEKLEFYNTEFGIRKNKEVFNISYKIDYVHQLQNIFFALTGTELTLKD